MAITTGQELKMVQVSTLAKYNDIANKDSGTLYWVVGAKKIYLDGVAYGFSEDDVTLSLLQARLSGDATGTIPVTVAVSGNTLKISASVKLSTAVGARGENMISNESGGLYVGRQDVKDVAIDYVQSYVATEVFDKMGAAGGFATLDNGGKVPSSQLPSYVDDVVEYASLSAFPTTGEAGKIYVAQDTNKTYRWTGTAYVEISASLALGETSSTAYRGDRGKAAYDHSQITGANPHGVTKAHVSLGSVENYGIATQAEAQAGTVNNKYMTPLRVAEEIAAKAPKVTWTVIT